MAIQISENVPLAPYTIYKIGGPARYLVEVRNAEELEEAFRWAAERGIVRPAPSLNLHSVQPARSASANFNAGYFILGAGSNVLVSDKGFNGLVIHMTAGNLRVDNERLVADAGVMMARAAAEAARAGLSGFEWGIGIPGTIGGSVRGNAGCFGGEMRDAVESADVLEYPIVKHRMFDNRECQFGYRDSVFKCHPEWVILSATLKLRRSDPAAIQEKVRRITAERLAKQDIGAKSCGCIFKNIPWSRTGINREAVLAAHPELAQFADRPTIPASFLIDAAGLKGQRAGRVVVSPKHANFFVNEGGAAARDVIKLAARIKEEVRKKFGLELEEEIQQIGFDGL